MTLLKHNYKTMKELDYFMNQFFNNPTISFSKPVTVDAEILGDQENYSIWELVNGMYEVRVKFSDDTSSYHRATTRPSLQEAEAYVEEQVAYHKRKLEGPKLVKSYKKINTDEK